MRVLIIDDNQFMRLKLKELFKSKNVEVVGEGTNGVEAIKLYSKLKPDVVTMDITMPIMDGIEATKEIMTLYPDAKIVIISAMGQESMVVQGIKNGASSFVVKPFKDETVISVIAKLF